MKCPEGTVEVSIWNTIIYFDAECGATSSPGAYMSIRADDLRNGVLLAALAPVMALGPHETLDYIKIWKFEPETFEYLTKDVT